MSTVDDFERVKKAISVAEGKASSLRGRIEEIESRKEELLKELKVTSLSDAIQKIERLADKVAETEKEIISEASKLGIVE